MFFVVFVVVGGYVLLVSSGFWCCCCEVVVVVVVEFWLNSDGGVVDGNGGRGTLCCLGFVSGVVGAVGVGACVCYIGCDGGVGV